MDHGLRTTILLVREDQHEDHGKILRMMRPFSQEEVEEMEVDFQELDSDGDLQEDDEDDEDAEAHEWSKMPRLGQVGRTVILWFRNHSFTASSPGAGASWPRRAGKHSKKSRDPGGCCLLRPWFWVPNFCGLNLGAADFCWYVDAMFRDQPWASHHVKRCLGQKHHSQEGFQTLQFYGQ